MHRLILLGIVCLLVPGAMAEVTLERDGHRIQVVIDGEPFTTFHFGPDTPKPYLHPLRAADGTVVTRSFPMEDVAGELQDHPHHRGAWFSHGDVNGVDFWANEREQRARGRKGTIALDAVQEVASGPEAGRVRATFSWQGPDGEPLLGERRAMTFSRVDGWNVVDFDLTLTAEAESVRLGDTKEGTFAVRMATELEEQHMRAKGIPRTGQITSATGQKAEARAWGKRAAWVDYAGSINGKPLGIAIFDHPSNPKHPTYWHVRGYGLFAANIFGEHDFYADSTRDGSITLAKGEQLRFRYRVAIHPGRTADAGIGGRYKAWATGGKQ